MPWKTVWVAAGGAATLAAGGVPVLQGWPWFLVAPAALMVTLLILWTVDDFVHRADVFRGRSLDQKQAVIIRVRVAVVAHWVWICALQVRPDLWMGLVGGLVALGAVEYGLAELHEYRVLHKRDGDPGGDAQWHAADGRPLDEVSANLVAALHDIGRGRAELLEYRHVVEGEGN